MAGYVSPFLQSYLMGQEQSNQNAQLGLQTINALSRQQALNQQMEQNRLLFPLQLQHLKAQIDALPVANQLKQVTLAKVIGEVQKGQRQETATNALSQELAKPPEADALSQFGYRKNADGNLEPIAGVPQYSASEGEPGFNPLSVNAQNPDRIKSLSIQADPSVAIPQLLKSISPQTKQSPLAALLSERAALPPGDSRIAAYDDAIKKQTTHQPPVNIYSGSLTPAIDTRTGKPTFIQPSGREDRPPRVITDYAPLPKPGDEKAAEKRNQELQNFSAIDQQITDLQKLIRVGEGTFTGTVGLKGIAGRTIETLSGLVPGNEFNVTPALQVQSKKELLIGSIRKLIDSGTLSNQDKERLENAIGTGGSLTSATTPGNAIQALDDLRKFLRMKLPRSSNNGQAGDAKPKAEDFFR